MQEQPIVIDEPLAVNEPEVNESNIVVDQHQNAGDGKMYVCFNRRTDTAVIPCGHAQFCFVCITKHKLNHGNKGCPICQGRNKNLVMNR